MYNKKGSGLRVDPQGKPTMKGSRRVRLTKDTTREWSHQWEENDEPVLLLGQRNREFQGESPRSRIAVNLRQLLGSKCVGCSVLCGLEVKRAHPFILPCLMRQLVCFCNDTQ